jgi:MFS family permease
MSFFKEGEWKLFWPFYVALFIGISTPTIYVIQTLFFLSRGISLTELGIAFGLLSLFIVLSEIPTGVIADRFGKKISIQIHWILHTITTALFIFISEPWQIYILFSIQGISQTFASGAFEALPYEICKKNKRKDLINEFYGKISFITQIGHFISYFGTIGVLFLLSSSTGYNILGINFQGMDFLWLIGALGYFLAFLIFFWLKEDIKKEKLTIKKEFIKSFSILRESLVYVKNHSILKRIFLVGFFLTISYILFLDAIHQSFLLNLGFDAKLIATIIALASIVGAIFSLIPKIIEKKFKTEKHYIEFTILLQIILLIGLYFFNHSIFYSMFFFFIYYNVHRCLREPIFEPFRQSFMKDSTRATIGSINSLIGHIAGIIFFPLGGFLLDNFNVINTTLFALIPLFLGLLILLSIKIKRK